MVRLSEILRKAEIKKSQDKESTVTEAVKLKKEMESLPGTKKIYEDAIISIKTILNDIKDGQTIEAREIFSVGRKIVDGLQTDYNMLLSLLNIFTPVEEKEDFHYRHTVNMAILSTSLGLSLEYEKKKLIDLCVCALMHDIGMLKLPSQVFLNDRTLTDHEKKAIEAHPTLAYRILKSTSVAESVALGVLEHQERFDGTGYPRKLLGDAISLYARIVAVASSYSAIISHRPFRSGRSGHEGILDLLKTNRRYYDERVLKALVYCISLYPLGLIARE